MSELSRRQFIRTTSIAAVCSLGFPSILRARGLNDKLQVGFIAVGGRASAHTKAAHEAGLHCVAFADVDRKQWGGVLQKQGWEGAQGYTDWRELFQKHGKELDVVFVATPDHSHFAPTMTAISMGIHCYTEKPLTWSVREAQLLEAAYAKNTSVVTQMGNQGHALEGWRVAYEYIQAGAIGEVREFHSWTNRPFWPQGGSRPTYTSPVPDTLNWDAWIGPAPMRPYAGPKDGQRRGPYHQFNWRGVVDFGSGALGDMACHITDGIYAIMNPGYAATAEPITMTEPVGEQWPTGMVVKNTYRAKGKLPGFSAFWYEGKHKDGTSFMPETPEELLVDGRTLPVNGNLVVGSSGKMLIEGSYWNSPQLLPRARRAEFGRPEKLLERSPGHHEEFFMACRGEKPRDYSQSNFSYAGPMTANVQLGNLCARAGKKLELNEGGVITSDPKINDLAWREPRKGWGPLQMKV
jgi:predicted dehydrogenase